MQSSPCHDTGRIELNGGCLRYSKRCVLMSPFDLYNALRKRPFEPFRVEVSDGTSYDVRHPELVMVGVGSVSIGIPATGQDLPFYQRMETISLAHAVKLLPLPASTSSGGNGAQGSPP